MRRPSGIIFDLGDTVLHLKAVNTLRGNQRLLEFTDNNPGVTAEDVIALVDEIFPQLDKARDAAMIEVCSQSFNKLLYETLGVSFRISYAELEREFWHAALTYVPVEGIYELLDMLDANRIQAGIISNTMGSGVLLEEELAKHNLAHRFSFVMSSADYGVRKPHEYIFRVAIKKMGLPPSELWFVGDKIEYDIKGALNSGLYPVWYNRLNEPRTIDSDYLEVKDLHELWEKIELVCGN